MVRRYGQLHRRLRSKACIQVPQPTAYWMTAKEPGKSTCVSRFSDKKTFLPKIVPGAVVWVFPHGSVPIVSVSPLPRFPHKRTQTVANAVILILRFCIVLIALKASFVLPSFLLWKKICFPRMVFFVKRAFKGQSATAISNHVAPICGHFWASMLGH